MLYNILFLFAVFSLKAQENLVPNGSFEDIDTCPIGNGQIHLSSNWYSASLGTPDLLHACGNIDVSVPQNIFGFQYARTGEAYANIQISVTGLGAPIREYIQCKLLSMLKGGSQYEISFWISLADNSKIACDNIGAYLSSFPIYQSNTENLPYLPTIKSSNYQPITNKNEWFQIIDTITASGNEEYLTIGVFSDEQNIYRDTVSNGNLEDIFYFVDDVSITLINEIIIPNVFTPDNNGVNDNIDFSFFSEDNIFILNRWGNIVFSNSTKSIWDGKDISGEDLPEGVYFYIIDGKNRKTGFIHLIR